MPESSQIMTYAEYRAMPNDGKRYELVHGLLGEMDLPVEVKPSAVNIY